jgi:hypothetical protein
VDCFGPYLGSVLESLVTLLTEVETNDAKRRIVNILVVVIGASKERVSELTNGPRSFPLTLISGHSPAGTPSRPHSCSMYAAAMFPPFPFSPYGTGEQPTSDATMKASLIEMTIALIKVGTKVRTTRKNLLNCICPGCKGAIWFYSTPRHGDGHYKYAATCKCSINHQNYLF